VILWRQPAFDAAGFQEFKIHNNAQIYVPWFSQMAAVLLFYLGSWEWGGGGFACYLLGNLLGAW
jgi:hypothetical protein